MIKPYFTTTKFLFSNNQIKNKKIFTINSNIENRQVYQNSGGFFSHDACASFKYKASFCNRVSLIIMFSGLALIFIYHYYYVIRYIGDGTDAFVTTAFKWIGFRDNEMDVYLLLMPVIASFPLVQVTIRINQMVLNRL